MNRDLLVKARGQPIAGIVSPGSQKAEIKVPTVPKLPTEIWSPVSKPRVADRLYLLLAVGLRCQFSCQTRYT